MRLIFASGLAVLVSAILVVHLSSKQFDAPGESRFCDDACMLAAKSLPEYVSPGYASTKPCHVIDMAGSNIQTARKALRKLQRSRQVGILRNSPITSQWSAFSKWNELKYLAESIPQLHNIRVGNDKLFTYEDWSRSMCKSSSLRSAIGNPTKKLVNMSMEEFLHRITSTDGVTMHEQMYYSHNLLHPLGFAQIASDVQSPQDLLVDISSKEAGLVNVWIGAAGIVAQSHYDPTDNIYVQIAGVKRFILASPNAWKSHYVYPFAHPRHRQSQVNFSNDEERSLKRFVGTDHAISATLLPGDILYIPSYWFHRVEALSQSLSVNAWSESVESAVITEMNGMGLPQHVQQHREASDDFKATILADYLSVLVDLLLPDCLGQGKSEFFENLFETKFAPNLEKSIPECRESCSSLSRSARTRSNVELWTQYSAVVGRRFREVFGNMCEDQQQAGVAQIILSDYVEFMSELFLGVEKICRFVKCYF